MLILGICFHVQANAYGLYQSFQIRSVTLALNFKKNSTFGHSTLPKSNFQAQLQNQLFYICKCQNQCKSHSSASYMDSFDF